MEMIRVYDRKTGEILEKTFANSKAADNYEVILYFRMAEYERYHDGEMICASEGEEKFRKQELNADDDYEGEPYEDEPVYENEQLDNMTDEDLEQELNSEEDFDDEKVFE